jgi:hypothetical protein
MLACALLCIAAGQGLDLTSQQHRQPRQQQQQQQQQQRVLFPYTK